MKSIVTAALISILIGCTSTRPPYPPPYQAPKGYVWMFDGELSLIKIKYNVGSSIMDSTMGALEGRDFSDALAYLGPYDEEMSDDKGGRILVWRKTTTSTTPGSVRSSTWYSENIDHERTTATITMPKIREDESWRMVWVDQEGIIYRTAWEGF